MINGNGRNILEFATILPWTNRTQIIATSIVVGPATTKMLEMCAHRRIFLSVYLQSMAQRQSGEITFCTVWRMGQIRRPAKQIESQLKYCIERVVTSTQREMEIRGNGRGSGHVAFFPVFFCELQGGPVFMPLNKPMNNKYAVVPLSPNIANLIYIYSRFCFCSGEKL